MTEESDGRKDICLESIFFSYVKDTKSSARANHCSTFFFFQGLFYLSMGR